MKRCPVCVPTGQCRCGLQERLVEGIRPAPPLVAAPKLGAPRPKRPIEQHWALAFLRADGAPRTIHEIAAGTAHQYSATCKALALLERAGLVVCHPCPVRSAGGVQAAKVYAAVPSAEVAHVA